VVSTVVCELDASFVPCRSPPSLRVSVVVVVGPASGAGGTGAEVSLEAFAEELGLLALGAPPHATARRALAENSAIEQTVAAARGETRNTPEVRVCMEVLSTEL
jgi:hypothetical protein